MNSRCESVKLSHTYLNKAMQKRQTPPFKGPYWSQYVSLAVCMCLQLFLVLSDAAGRSCADENYHISELNKAVSLRKVKPLDINIAFLTSVRNSGGGKFYAGAFFLAVDELNRMAADANVSARFQWTFRDTDNKESEALQEMAHLYCAHHVSAFIGPDVYCKSAGLLATGFRVPYITFNCEESHNDTLDLLLVNTETSIVFVARFLASLLEHYHWKSFWLVSGVSIKWTNVANQLRTIVAAKNISINGDTPERANNEYGAYLFISNPYRNILETSRHKTRVYVFLGDYESLLMFVGEMAALGLTDSGEYAVVAVDDSNHNRYGPSVYLNELERRPDSQLTETQIRHRLLAMQNVLILSPVKCDVNQAAFESAVYNRSMLPPINLIRTPISISRPPKIDIQAYQLYDATMIYGKAVLQLMSMEGADPENASHIINHIRCRFHDSIDGQKMWIHENGESEGTYIVKNVDFHHIDGQQYLREVGNFTSKAAADPVYHTHSSVAWINGHPPVSNPECGFGGELCPSSHVPPWKMVSITVGIFVLLLAIAVTATISLRHYLYEKKLDRLAWKIEREDIQMLNTEQIMEVATPVKVRKKDSAASNHLRSWLLECPDPDLVGEGCCTAGDMILAVYKGNNVAVRKLTRKNLELTRSVKKQLQLRKELTHDNINRFIGACIQLPDIYLLTQYCPRNSLQDILNNEDSQLDEMFVTSLVQDLIRGVSFIHDSEMIYHGNLKSSNCLVDSRWTLKLTDFGLTSLGYSDVDSFDDEETARGLLWTAPELLRCRRRSSNSSSSHNHHFYHSNKHNNNSSSSYSGYNGKTTVTGSQKGDVYSFAIILYELYGQSGPWGHTKLSCAQIIESLLDSTTPVLRPDVSALRCDVSLLSLMQVCWDNNPDLRPDFKYGIRNRFKPIQQSCLKSNIFDNMLAMMEKYANNLEVVVAERTEQLRLEKKMTENLLLRMLPRSVAEKLKRGQRVQAEQFEQVSIYFSDIVGFTELSAESTPMEVVDLLNDLYTCFDSIIEDFDVYKVETIGDAYMVVSGLPIRNGDRHAGEIGSMSLLLLEAIKRKQFCIGGRCNYMLKIRIGIHSGPCCAGVVGLKMPRYCLFGDTVNTASRLETTGEALKIHCSSDCKTILDKLGGYTLVERGYTEMKGKGRLLTYFLISEDRRQRHNRMDSYKQMGRDGRCVSTSNLDYSGKIFSISNKGLSNVNLYTNRDTPGHKNSSSDIDTRRSTVHTTTDPSWTELPDKVLTASSASSREFISSTLPRVSNPRFNNCQMSPIDEVPSSLADRILEKTTSVPESRLLESSASEHDASLGGKLARANIDHNMRNVNRRTQSSLPLLARSSKPGIWRMESFNEDDHDASERFEGDHYTVEVRDDISNSVVPETEL